MGIEHKAAISLCAEGDLEKLRNKKMPERNTDEEIALAMGISVEKLRFLASNYPTKHYFCFPILKKTGEARMISAPMPDLKTAQRWILRNILEKLEVHDAAHGFRQNRSIVTNAKPHVGADIVVKLDLQNFFQSISYKRVKELFCEFGYSEDAAKILGLICTVVDLEEIDGITHTNTGKRCLPQGSPASPAISNLICDRLDSNLTEIAAERGFRFTRYADDLTFSSSKNAWYKVYNLINKSKSIITNEGFTVNPNKIQILTKSVQQEVTGIVVNRQLNISRSTLKAFRATLYQIEQEGLSDKKWGKSSNLIAAITGFANYVAMVNPSKGAEFLTSVKRIKHKYELSE